LLGILLLAPLIGYLPMASLAALLMLVAWNMSEAKHFLHALKVAPKSDVAVLLTCYVLTVVFDMVVAVTAGMILASFLFMRRMAETSEGHLIAEDQPQRRNLPREAMLYQVNGPLFFGAAESAMEAFKAVGVRPEVVILDLSAVPAMDVTGLVALESALARLKQQKVLTIIAGLRPQPAQVLRKAGLGEEPGLFFSETLDAAAIRAEQHLASAVRQPKP
ncbi:MAG TPA: STAS domain-containing protein, partial [Myxococcales bacterium]|nr:STAS domain-containing protein [Myxococcales bacterium]